MGSARYGMNAFGASALDRNRTVERRRGPMGSRMLCVALAGNAKRFATRLFVTMQRDWKHDRPKGYSPRRLTADEEAALAAVIIAGPEPGATGFALDPGRSVPLAGAALRQDLPPLGMTRVLRRMGFSRQAGEGTQAQERARHPEGDRRAHPDKRCGFRMKRALCHRWWRGASVPRDQIGSGPTSSPPCARTPRRPAKVKFRTLRRYPARTPVMMDCDGAGWHDERALTVPDNVTLASLNPAWRLTTRPIDACCQM